MEINEIPFHLDWVGDLLFFDWPIISVLRNEHGQPFIKSWLESHDNINRYAVFEVSKHLLEEYVFKNCSYLDVLLNPLNDLIFTIDTSNNGNILSTKIISSTYVPKKYLPKKHILFDSEDSIQLEHIIEAFGLEDSSLSEQPFTFDILEEANKIDSELINLHFSAKDSKVGYGKIESQILGEILVNYHKMAEATALNIYEKDNDVSAIKNIKYKKDEVEFIKKLAATEYSYDKAASFSVFLRPVKIIEDKELNQTSSEKITDSIFELFNAGANLIELEKFNTNFSGPMLNAFSVFLKSIKENDITVTVKYGNPQKQSYQAETFNSKKSETIIKNLSSFEKGDPIENRLHGTFTALDKDHHTFRFLNS